MPLSLKDPETERLARDLAHRAGETITGATKKALEERLRRFRSEHEKTMLLDLAAIRHRFASLPRFDEPLLFKGDDFSKTDVKHCA